MQSKWTHFFGQQGLVVLWNKMIENHPQTPPAKAKKSQVKPFKPQAYKYYIEQNLQNLEVELEQRLQRQFKLEFELEFYDITEPHLKEQLRLKLRQKEIFWGWSGQS